MQLVFTPLGSTPPATSYATFDVRAGGSTPAESVPVLDFDAAADEFADWIFVLPNDYAGGGLTCTVWWSATSATSGNAVIGLAFRAVPDDTEDIDTSQTYDYNEATDACASVSGEIVGTAITFTDGADMDSLAAGGVAVLRMRRNADDGSDTMAGDLELWAISIVET